MKNTVLIVAMLLVSASVLQGQFTDESWVGGIAVGANGSGGFFKFKNSQISGLSRTIIPNVFVENTYDVKESHHYGFVGGLFFSRRFSAPYWLGLQADVLFSKHIGGYDYSDIKGLTYEMRFNYWYANIVPSLKFYPCLIASYGDVHWWTGFYLRLGLLAGVNLSSRDITYIHSPQDIYGTPIYVEKELRAVLNGKGNFGFIGGLGWEKELDWGGLFIDARYCHGTADVLEVSANTYGFDGGIINNIRNLQLTVGVAKNLSR